MKKIDEFTTEELANLTNAEINWYKTKICANKGIKIVNKPIMPNHEHIKYDKQGYHISGLDYLVFEDVNEAKFISDTILKAKSLRHISYCNGVPVMEKGPSTNYNGMPYSFIPEVVEGFSNRDLAYKQIDLDKKFNDELSKYQKDQEKYNTYLNSREDATKEFVEKQKAAKDKYTHQEDLINIYINTYLPLAENNEKVAMNFLKKAYNVTEEDEKVIMERINKYNKTNNK